jgi:hypothetical protein
MMLRTLLSVGCLLGIAAVVGCGGAGGSGGPSLASQYQEAMTIPDPTARVTQLLSIADQQDKAGDLLGTQTTLGSAAAAAKSIEDPSSRGFALNRVVATTAQIDSVTKAKDLLKEVRKAAEAITDPEAKVPVLARMAYNYGRYIDAMDTAQLYLKQCEEVAATIPRPEGQVAAMLDITLIHHGLENTDKANAVMDSTLDLARELEDVRKRADSLADAAALLFRMDQQETAEQVFAQSQQAAESLEDNLSKGFALLHLSTKLGEAGYRVEAQDVSQAAEDVADQVGDQSMRQPLVDKIYAARSRL